MWIALSFICGSLFGAAVGVFTLALFVAKNEAAAIERINYLQRELQRERDKHTAA